jgi:hypothetical protein
MSSREGTMKNEDELIRELFAYVGRVKGSTPSGAYMAIFLAGVTMPLWKRYMGDYQVLIDFVNANKDKCDRAEPKASPAASIRVLDLGAEVFSFASLDDWKERAKDLYAEVYRKGHLQDELMAIDSRGRVCSLGRHFMRAADDNAYPVTVYSIETGRREGNR